MSEKINPIQINILLGIPKGVDQNSSKISQISQIHLLPAPNYLILGGSSAILPKNLQGFVCNTDPSQPLFSDISTELEEEQISITWKEQVDMPNLESNSFYLGSKNDLFEGLKKFQREEAYSLNISSQQISISTISLHGLFNAFQTLKQIINNGKNLNESPDSTNIILPTLDIFDWPSLEVRGIADDVSRGQIPTVESAKRFIKEMSHYKNNYYALYIEDVFSCSSHPKIGEERGAFTPEELIELDKYAQSRFVTLFPIFETLGHMDNILTIPEYQELGEFPGAQSLAVSNGNIYPLLRDFIEELSPCFSSKIFHMGCDETFDLGHGCSKEITEVRGHDGVLLDHYQKVYNIAKENGNKQIMVYHDVALKYPSLLKLLPKDLIFMYWDYVPKKKFPNIIKIVDEGFPVIVSSSMLCWGRHFPDYQTASKNIINIIENAKSINRDVLNKYDFSQDAVMGQLNSTWGDFCNSNLRENNIYGAILSASASWTKDPLDYNLFLKDLGFLFYGLKSKEDNRLFVESFNNLNSLIDLYKRGPAIMPQNFYSNLFRHPFRKSAAKPLIKQYLQLNDKCEKILSDLEELSPKILRNEHYFQYLPFASKLAQTIAKKDMLTVNVNTQLKKYIKQKAPISNEVLRTDIISKIDAFNVEINEIIEEYEKLWIKCAKRPNLDYLLGRFNSLVGFLKEKKDQINESVAFIDPMIPSAYIWTWEKFSKPKSRYFRRTFNIENQILDAKVQVIAGNAATIYVNGQYVGEVQSRMSLSILAIKKSVQVFDITPYLQEGKNVIGVEANHYLESIAYFNLYLELKEKNSEGTGIISSILSDNKWIFNYGPFESAEWSTPDYKVDESKWQRVKVVGYPPALNLDIYRPKLLEGQRSYPEDLFGFTSSLYYMISLFMPKFVAKIVRFLSPKLWKFLG
jgi:5'-deoxynucleotidase YfbR-like HD superfamily hydrolase